MDNPTFTKHASPPQVRIGDAERQAAADQLQQHFAAGRITWEELDERLALVWTARVYGDLTGLFVDLPMLAPPTPQYAPARAHPERNGVREGVMARVQHLDVWVLVVMALVAATLIGVTDGAAIPIALVGWFVFAGRRHGHRFNGRHHHRYGHHHS